MEVVVLYHALRTTMLTLGISIAARKGGVLAPLVYWCEQVGRKEQLRRARLITYIKKRLRRPKANRQLDMQRSEQIRYLEMRLSLMHLWHKPLISCAYCMPSVWASVSYLQAGASPTLYMYLLTICVSSFMNFVLWNLLKRLAS